MAPNGILSSRHTAAYVPVSEVERIVHSLGVQMTIACGVMTDTHRIRLGLTTSDNDPLLTLRADDRDSEQWLSGREQSAPERWDYESEIRCHRERFFIALEHTGRSVDLAFAPAACAMLTTHGWTDDASRTAEACVDRQDLLQCLQLLGVHPTAAEKRP